MKKPNKKYFTEEFIDLYNNVLEYLQDDDMYNDNGFKLISPNINNSILEVIYNMSDMLDTLFS